MSGVTGRFQEPGRLVGPSFAVAHIPHPDDESETWCGAAATSWNRIAVDEATEIDDCPDCQEKRLERKSGRRRRVEA